MAGSSGKGIMKSVKLKAEVYDISVSGPGNLVALGRNDQIQVLEILGRKAYLPAQAGIPGYRLTASGWRL